MRAVCPSGRLRRIQTMRLNGSQGTGFSTSLTLSVPSLHIAGTAFPSAKETPSADEAQPRTCCHLYLQVMIGVGKAV